MPEGIQVRGPYQFRVQVRRNGVYQTKTFEKLSDAREGQRVMEGKVTGEELVDRKRVRSTTLAQACDWMLDGKHVGTNADAKNVSPRVAGFNHYLDRDLYAPKRTRGPLLEPSEAGERISSR